MEPAQPRLKGLWELAEEWAAWIGSAPPPTNGGPGEALEFAANIFLVARGIRPGYLHARPKRSPPPPSFAAEGLQTIEAPPNPAAGVRLTLYSRRAEPAAGEVFAPPGEPERCEALGEALGYLYPASPDTFPAMVSWVCTGYGLGHFVLWSEKVPVGGTGVLEAISARGHQLREALAPTLFTVQARLE